MANANDATQNKPWPVQDYESVQFMEIQTEDQRWRAADAVYRPVGMRIVINFSDTQGRTPFAGNRGRRECRESDRRN